jgi:molybdopterin/thiamine biosynthesis adenylyltransferase
MDEPRIVRTGGDAGLAAAALLVMHQHHAAAFVDVACVQMGVLAPLVGIVGSMQAAEAIKLLAGAGMGLVGWLGMLDAHSLALERIRIARDANCSVCGSTGSARAKAD